MIPGFNLSVISVRLMIPLNGNPLAIPYDKSINERSAFCLSTHTLAIVMMSGITPLYSHAKYFPVLPKPV